MGTYTQRFKIVAATVALVLAMVTGSGMSNLTANAAPPQWQPGNVTQVSAGDRETCAVASGAAYCWGDNTNGQLGDGTTNPSANPRAVSTAGVLAGKTVAQVSVGNQFACAVASGAAYCWGENDNGQLGDGSTNASNLPVAVTVSGALAGKTVTQIGAGSDFACALASGNVYCWGVREVGQLGNGISDSSPSSVPVAVAMTGALAGKTVTQIAVGYDHACVVANGAAYCWGAVRNGQLGNGDTTYGNSSNVPVAVDSSGALAGKVVSQVSAAYGHTCAVASGAAYCWGDNANGQLGNGTKNNSSTPVAVNKSGTLVDKAVSSVSSGPSHTCAVASGAAYCWGYNAFSLIGDGTNNDSSIPVAVDSSEALASKTITQVSSGYTQTCGIANGSMYCWGQNANGVLGDGTNNFGVRLSPVYVSTRPANSSDRVITNVSFGMESGKKIMTIRGEYLVNEPDPQEYLQGISGKSFVSINGVSLNFCTDGTGYDSATLSRYGIMGSTDSNPCYYLLGTAFTPAISDKMAKVYLADDFNTTAQGAVSVNGSNPYVFNQQSTVQTPSVSVNNAPLSNNALISKRPTFSGTAQPGSVVTVTVHSDPVSCTAIADTNGNWSCTLPLDLEPGQHTAFIRVVAPDNSVVNLGPYAVSVPGATITNQTPFAPMTGEGRNSTMAVSQVIAAGFIAVVVLTIFLNGMYVKLRALRRRV